MEQLRRQMRELQRKMEARDESPEPRDALATPFTRNIIAEPLPRDFRFPSIKPYTGATDPRDHLNRYKAVMMMTGTQDWFGSLLGDSIPTFAVLAKKFMSHFVGSIQRRKQFADLCYLKQHKSESLAEYLSKWKKEAMGVTNFDERSAIPFFTNNLRSGPFHSDLVRNEPNTYTELMDRAARYANVEAAEKRKKEEEEGRSRGDKATQPQEDRCPPRSRRDRGPRLAPLRHLTPLTQPVSLTLDHAEEMSIVSFPEECLKISPKSDPKKYCRFHRQRGHDNDECMVLKRQIEELIQRGYLGQYVKRSGQDHAKGPDNTRKKKDGVGPSASAQRKRELGQLTEDEETEPDNPPKKKVIHVIFGGPEGGNTPAERKRWARSLYVGEVVGAPHEKRTRRELITFTDDDLPDGPLPHRDALVIRLELKDIIVHRVLVDTGSSVNVMYYDTFTQLGLSRKQLSQVRTPLSGFTGDSIETEGSITLEVQISTPPHIKTWEVEFVVVKISCAHNIILGRPVLEDARCVISMEHLCLKFPTPTGVGVARGDQKISQSCYLKACRQITKKDLQVHTVIERALREEEKRPRAEPVVDTEEVILDLSRPDRMVKVGTVLPADLRGRIVEVICSYKDVFAWGPEDMSGLSREVITDKLAVDPKAKPVQQRKRYLAANRREFVKKEVDTLLEIGHIREVIYPTWLENIVLAPKPPTWRMCVDYTDLNKACPMDPFPLPNIDYLVDETAGCALMSFLDAFRGYHQIFMHEDDEEKTAFTTP
ncbi:PREDICTED: uncharacterized protein LOC109192140 [Ipomoea nil]|uniref:uncharacterized protein LOC109192140 n=1 Tax=Ipomoea nil TaxID=35883 RepID=UPI00090185FE|nr:PREDICTED: uncharacterized protein LOC109192140 [Ipomoea nil]